jgi:hypothetical protein
MANKKYGIQFSLYSPGVTTFNAFLHEGSDIAPPKFSLFEFGSIEFNTEREAIEFVQQFARGAFPNTHRAELVQFVRTRMLELDQDTMEVLICVKVLNRASDLLSLVGLEYTLHPIGKQVSEDRISTHPKLDGYSPLKVGFFKCLFNLFKK